MVPQLGLTVGAFGAPVGRWHWTQRVPNSRTTRPTPRPVYGARIPPLCHSGSMLHSVKAPGTAAAMLHSLPRSSAYLVLPQQRCQTHAHTKAPTQSAPLSHSGRHAGTGLATSTLRNPALTVRRKNDQSRNARLPKPRVQNAESRIPRSPESRDRQYASGPWATPPIPPLSPD